MALSTIRKSTDEDFARLEKSAVRFITKHFGEKYVDDSANASMVETLISSADYWEKSDLSRKWDACMCRAFKVSYDKNISYGYGCIGVAI